MNNSITQRGLEAMYKRASTRLPDIAPTEVSLDIVFLREEYTQFDVQTVANLMARHYGLKKPVLVEYVDLPDTTPGQIFINETPDYVRIQIDSDNRPRPRFTNRQMLCILAHELAHEFIAERGIGYDNRTTNEYFTDFMAVYMGFGHFMIDGCENRVVTGRSGNFTHYSVNTMGYLTKEQMVQARNMVYSKGIMRQWLNTMRPKPQAVAGTCTPVKAVPLSRFSRFLLSLRHLRRSWPVVLILLLVLILAIRALLA